MLVRVFLWPTLRHGYPLPVGPDVPVYLWWTRVAEFGGISMASERPGAPALIGTMQGVLDQGLVGALAGLQYALGPTIGLAAAALARGRGRTLPRGGWLAAGLLAGAWATFLGGGYVSNLVFTAAFLAAAAALARRTRRATLAAALVLGGGAITHPGFFVVGAGILAVTGLWAALHEGRFGWRTDAGRVVTVLGGAAAIFVAGLVAATIGGATGRRRNLIRRVPATHEPVAGVAPVLPRPVPRELAALLALHDERARTRRRLPRARVRPALPVVVGADHRAGARARRRDRVVPA